MRTRGKTTLALTLAISVLGGCAVRSVEGEAYEEIEAAGPLPTPPPPSRTTSSPAGSWTSAGPNPQAPSPPSDGGTTPVTPTPPPNVAPPTVPNGTPVPSAPATTNDPYEYAREFCAQRINQYRASLGRQALARVPAAEYCTDRQCVSDSQTQSAHGAFSACNEFAQNECPGWPGPLSNVLPSCLDSMWAEGPGGGHYENMASANYRYVACGFYQAPNGAWWIIQNFR